MRNNQMIEATQIQEETQTISSSQQEENIYFLGEYRMEEINLDEQNIQQQTQQQLNIEIETLKDEIECCFDFLKLFVPKQSENKLKTVFDKYLHDFKCKRNCSELINYMIKLPTMKFLKKSSFNEKLKEINCIYSELVIQFF